MRCEISFKVEGRFYIRRINLPYYPRKGDRFYVNGVELLVTDRVYFDLDSGSVECHCEVYQVSEYRYVGEEELRRGGWHSEKEDERYS